MATDLADQERGQILSDAAFEGDTVKLTALLASGIPIDSRDKDGFTALHRSCVTGNATVVQFLIDQKANVNVEDTYGDSPMHYACFCGHLAVVAALLKAGGDPHKRSKDGKTPLRSAQEEGHVPIVTLLTAHSASTKSATSSAIPGPAVPPGPPPPAYIAPGGGATPFTPSDVKGGGAATKSKGLTTAGSVAGLDFTSGVIMEGDLGKKRKNRMLKWRRKYYVLSRTYGALFFWTGTRERVDGVIKKVRFETLLSVVHHPDKKDGKRFDLRVVTGRTMHLLASTTQEAKLWVTTLHSVVGPSMAAIRIQSAWRRYRAQRMKRKLLAERSEAVARLANAAGGTAMNAHGGLLKTPGKLAASKTDGSSGSASKASGSPHIVHGAIKSESKGTAVLLSTEGILVEGELKKKNSAGVGSLLSTFRTRYFVLHQHDAALYYFDTKAKRHAGVRPRAVPVLSFYSVKHVTDRKGIRTCAFELRVVSGRSFMFEARSVAVAENWVRFLNAVLPKQHVAALKIQRTYKRFKAVLLLKKLRAEAKLKQPSVAPAGGTVVAGGPWVKYVHGTSGRDYWHNPITKETLWTDPTIVPIGDWMPTRDPTSGRMYYFNQKTKQTSWEKPVLASSPEETVPSSRKRARWIQKSDASTGRTFYANVDTSETSWSRPVGLDDRSAILMGEWFSKELPGGGRKFYVHVSTNRTQWDRPDGYSSDGEPVAKSDPAAAAPVSAEPELVESTATAGNAAAVASSSSAGNAAAPARITAAASTAPPLAASAVAPIAAPEAAVAQAVVVASSASLPPPPPAPASDASSSLDWSEITDPDGGPSYYYNAVTGESVWDRPLCMDPRPPPPPPPPKPTTAAGVQAALHKKRHSHTATVPPPAPAAVSRSSAGGGAGKLQRSISTRVVGVGGTSGLELAGKGASSVGGAAEADGWRQAIDAKSNRICFFNVLTGESTWERPVTRGGLTRPSPPAGADEGEVFTFSRWINERVAGDVELQDAGVVPVVIPAPGASTEHAPIFEAMRSGVLACKLVNSVARDTVDMRAVDLSAAPGSAAATDNCRLALAAAQSVGCLFTKDITPASVSAGQAQPILDFLWQLIKLQIISPVSVRNREVSGMVLLATEEETIEDLLRLSSEALLLRWLNFQIAGDAKSSSVPTPSPAREFGVALTDSVVLCNLMRRLLRVSASSTGALALPATDAAAAASPAASLDAVIEVASALGAPRWFSGKGLLSGNIRLQLAFVATVFKACPNMPDPEAPPTVGLASVGSGARDRSGTANSVVSDTPVALSKVHVSAHASALRSALQARFATEDRDGDRQSLGREARTVAQWVNTLDIEGVMLHGQAIAQELRDGVGLLKLLDVVEPGIVKWSKVNVRPTNRYKMVENCNYAVNLGRAMDFHLVNMSGLDLVDSNAKLLLAYMWQLMRYHTLKQLSTLAFNGFTADEAEVLTWANTQVTAAVVSSGQPAEAATRISSFADPDLATGIFLLYLLNAVRPGCVNWDVVLEGDGREQQEANAKYVISTARRLDITVLCSWEDIADVKPRALVLLVAALMVADSAQRNAAASTNAPDEGDDADSDDE